jgi:hypothetical protein
MKKERHDGSGHVGSFVSPVEKGGGSVFGSQSGQSVEWRAYALCADWNMGPRRGGGFGGSAGRRSAEPPPTRFAMQHRQRSSPRSRPQLAAVTGVQC